MDGSGSTMMNDTSAMTDNTNTSTMIGSSGSIFNNRAMANISDTMPDIANAVPDNSSTKKRRLSNAISEAEAPQGKNSKRGHTKKPDTEPTELRRSQRATRGQRNVRAIVHYTEISNAQVNPKEIFPILDLPREIRDMIYDRLFHNIQIHSQSYGIKFSAMYGQDVPPLRTPLVIRYRKKTRGLPNWLSSNKQILSEGLEQFHRQAYFLCSSNGYGTRKKTGKEGAISISKAKTLDLGDLTGYSTTGLNWVLDTDKRVAKNADGKRMLCLEFDHPYDIAIQHITSKLGRYPSVLQDLTITFEATCWMDNLYYANRRIPHGNLPTDSEIHTAIGFLEKLPHGLNRATFDVTLLGRMEGWYTRIAPVLCAELKRIGLALVLGPGQQVTESETTTMVPNFVHLPRQYRRVQITSTQWKGPATRTQASE